MLAHRDNNSVGSDFQLPLIVKVTAVRSLRYAQVNEALSSQDWWSVVPDRPENWDDRVAGIDFIQDSQCRVFQLKSSGQQSVPKPGWVIQLLSGSSDEGYTWTLYGLPA